MKKKIFVFGNEFIEGDEIAKKVAKHIEDKFEDINFILAESPNEILNSYEELIILDVVKNLNDVKIISKIDDLVLSNSLSCHDLDLGFYLKLMKEIGKITEVKIIGIPYCENFNSYNFEGIVEKIITLIQSNFL